MKVVFCSLEESHYELRNLNIKNTVCVQTHNKNRITQFTPEQKLKLINLVQRLERLVRETEDLKFICLQEGTYWDFPFTIETSTIVLTSVFFNPELFSDPFTVLVHEWLHLQQRRRPLEFEKLYNKWGFRKVPGLRFPSSITEKLLQNPDGRRYEWVWRSGETGREYAPLCIVDNCKFVTMVGLVENGKIGDIVNISTTEYQQKFSYAHPQLYHPNEISAHKLAHEIVNGKQDLACLLRG